MEGFEDEEVGGIGLSTKGVRYWDGVYRDGQILERFSWCRVRER